MEVEPTIFPFPSRTPLDIGFARDQELLAEIVERVFGVKRLCML